MKKIFCFFFVTVIYFNSIAQKHVGIGTTTPLAALHVADSSVLFSGPPNFQISPSPPPITGPGSRMMWYVSKGAFRAGLSTGDSWDQANLGYTSFATGVDTRASGGDAVALGNNTTASGEQSTALGYLTNANGHGSTAIGVQTTASGAASFAAGNFSIASGTTSTSIGTGTTASGDNSTAIGNDVSTNAFAGAFIIGDNSTSGTVTNCFRINEFRARFNGGYALYTNAATSTGVFMLNGANSWSSISDSSKKEQFKKTDGEYVLNSIGKMKLGSWNYKSQTAKNFRHYGPMAQEFYNAFGNDGIGKIGCDTLIGSADIDGIMMIALQALEKRSAALAKENDQLKSENLAVEKKLADLQNQFADKLALLETKMNEMLALKEKKATNKSALSTVK
jgi:hypothetical protein